MSLPPIGTTKKMSLDCQCQGAEHIVCKKWKVPTAKNLRWPGYVPDLTLGKAVAQGLVTRPHAPCQGCQSPHLCWGGWEAPLYPQP